MKTQRFIKKCLKGIQFFLLLLIGGAYVWVITFLAENGNWVGISALTTMLLAIAAFWTIWDRREQEKRDRKERLLNEIIEWAINCRPISTFIKYANIKNEWEYNIMTASDSLDKYRSLENRGEYISKIAGKLGEDLGNAVEKVLTNIKERHILLVKSMAVKPAVEIGKVKETAENLLSEVEKLRQYLSNKNQSTWDSLSEEAKASFVLGENTGALNKSVSKVIEKAVEIKTKDIG